MGRCTTCQEWDSLQEETVLPDAFQLKGVAHPSSKPIRLSEVSSDVAKRSSSGIAELDRVLGGGIVPGSLVLVGGEPGIGKSTLLLQMAASFAKGGEKVLYISGEESVAQLRDRAKRLGIDSQNLFLFSESDLSYIESQLLQLLPQLIILDSIQMVYHPDLDSAPGTLVQIRGCAVKLMGLAKKVPVPVFIVGHVTKEGSIAGPKILEHLVDTVLYFEGEKSLSYRLLRAVKNRYGTVDEVGIFRMEEDGLAEVQNPSEMFLEEKPKGMNGSVVVSSLEGTRPLFLEIQALVSRSRLSFPNRRSSGIDLNRLSLLIAVLEKRARVNLEGYDVFVNVAGGMKINEPAADLGLLAAIASAAYGIEVEEGTLLIGEVGLGGEIRHVQGLSRRVTEAGNLGFKRCILPKSTKSAPSSNGLQLIVVQTLQEALQFLFKGNPSNR
jgi:DNA repair protein RadA/Sms